MTLPTLSRSYLELDDVFYTSQAPHPVMEPRVYVYNGKLANQLNIDLEESEIEYYFSGNKIIPGTVPFAQAYAGHQFGHFTMLGDGRAIILGEIRCKDDLYDIQLKGSGRTPYSRGGDGRATLPTMLREYLVSEAMHHLKIPTTRSLCVIVSSDSVYREKKESGSVLTRIAKSHIRIGTFEYAAFLGLRQLRQLFNYTIERHYPELTTHANPAQAFLREVMRRQINLVVNWMRVGFIHGVMNTDNTSISGETIDFGPCAFINAYDDEKVYSSIDTYGRYSFGNQPSMAKWNIEMLADSILPLIDDDKKKAFNVAKEAISEFDDIFDDTYMEMMGNKLGLVKKDAESKKMIGELLGLMKKYQRDYTNVFFKLSEKENPFTHEDEIDWFKSWKAMISKQDPENTEKKMRSANPVVIPRNHRVEKAIRDRSEFQDLLRVLENPYDNIKYDEEFQNPPESEDGYMTFCGT